MTTTSNLTIGTANGIQALPQVTTWDRFYQAALRAQIIANPMDELDALLLAQELAAQDGIQLMQVPATGRSGPFMWGRGASARKNQTYWFELMNRMGMTLV